ncbi:MAG TPA: hypothetical protein ENI94_05120 [Gammaproteobacteria bacterium]|nr:hypothetical protein [Gammaproteobacteria bacterium]
MKELTGWAAILLAVFSLAPSVVPGAMSVMGLSVSLTALIISVFSVSSGRKNYFIVTLTIVVFGVFFVNDVLRVWASLPVPMNVKFTLYGLFGVVVLSSMFFAKKLSNK